MTGRRRTRYVSVSVDIDFEEISTEEMLEELDDRGVVVRDAVEHKARIERLYYATRGDRELEKWTIDGLRDLVADLYGRAT